MEHIDTREPKIISFKKRLSHTINSLQFKGAVRAYTVLNHIYVTPNHKICHKHPYNLRQSVWRRGRREKLYRALLLSVYVDGL